MYQRTIDHTLLKKWEDLVNKGVSPDDSAHARLENFDLEWMSGDETTL